MTTGSEEPHDGSADLEVLSWHQDRAGTLSGDLRRAEDPSVTYALLLAPDGRVLQVTVRAAGDDGLPARVLRQTPLATMARALRAASASAPAPARTYLPPTLSEYRPTPEDPALLHARQVAAWRSLAAEFTGRRRTGAAGRSDLPYAAVAAAYAAAYDRGERSPLGSAAAELRLSSSSVRNYLTKARDRGLLTAAAAGRPGGSLTPKAVALLGAARPT